MSAYSRKFLYIFFILLLPIILLAAVGPATAITINSVSVLEPDTFYSSFANNSVVRLVVNVTGINNTPGNEVSLTANFISLGVNCNATPGSSTIFLANTGADLWTGLCDVGDEASATTFKSGQVIVIANETYGAPSVNTGLVLSIYNIGIPSGNTCYIFGEGSTNFNQVTNFNDVDITLVIEADDDSSCVPVKYWNGGLRVAKLKFNGVNFGNNAADVQKLSQLSNIVKMKFSLPRTYQDTRISVDTTTLPELNVNTFNVELYHLSVMMPTNSFIVSDNNVAAEAITWTSNGYEQMLNESTYNLTFTVSQGFKGYNITDSIAPISSLHFPTPGVTTNLTSIVVNFTANGTGTGISKVYFYLNGAMVAAFNNSVNTANCTLLSVQNPEVYACLFALARSDGTYNLSVQTYDFGKSPGNSLMINSTYNVQTGPPYVKISVPKDDGRYVGIEGSMLVMTFNVSDGNGIDACTYSIDGPVSVDKGLIKGCKKGMNSLQLYLESGSYDLDISVNDTLGLTSTASVSFDVSDTAVPKILNRTVKISHDEATLIVITDESASCRYDSSDSAYSQMDDEFDDNITIHTAVFDVSDRDSEDFKGTEYIYYIRCSDLSDNDNTGSLAVNLIDVNSTVAVSNGTVDTVRENKEDSSKTFDLGLLLAGRKILNIDDPDIPFTDMLLTTNSAADDVMIKITASDNSTIAYPEDVYSYIIVEHRSIKESNVEDVLIKFRVSKEWLDSNDLSEGDVFLFRYDDGWKELNTTAGSEKDGYISYTADSPGLSLFAISKIHVEEPVVDVKPSLNDTNVTINNINNDTVSVPDTSEKGSFNWIWILVVIAVFVLVALFILVERNERNSPPPIFPQDRTLMSRIKRLFR